MLLPELEAFGEVMALTRNDACVHEKHGVYENVHTDLPHGMGMVLDDPIDLRLFCARWASGFAVATPWEGGPDGLRRSLQFFDAHGDAVHKIFLTRKSELAAYAAFVEAHTDADASPLTVTPRPAPDAETPDAEIDADALLTAWAGLQDTHDFFPLLRQHGVTRTQALRLAEGRFTERADGLAVRRALEAAVETETPIMVFVGNPGGVQIHTGPVKKLMERGPWFNVLDPGIQPAPQRDADCGDVGSRQAQRGRGRDGHRGLRCRRRADRTAFRRAQAGHSRAGGVARDRGRPSVRGFGEAPVGAQRCCVRCRSRSTPRSVRQLAVGRAN